MTPDIATALAKPVIALSVAGTVWIAEVAIPSLPGVPDWISQLGLPVAFLVAVIYALCSTHKALRESEKGRRDDMQGVHEKFERMIERSQESRERLIRATDLQTAEFKALADQLKRRPCQKEIP
jgi:septal ring factor EnvC (AmiA/AmiB activator)